MKSFHEKTNSHFSQANTFLYTISIVLFTFFFMASVLTIPKTIFVIEDLKEYNRDAEIEQLEVKYQELKNYAVPVKEKYFRLLQNCEKAKEIEVINIQKNFDKSFYAINKTKKYLEIVEIKSIKGNNKINVKIRLNTNDNKKKEAILLLIVDATYAAITDYQNNIANIYFQFNLKECE